MIHGRRDVRAFAAAREPGVRALAGNPDAPVNATWDTWFLKQLVTADLDPVTGLGDEGLEERAGSGGHEIRTWLTGFAAAGRPLAGRATNRYRNGSPAWVSARLSRWPDVDRSTVSLLDARATMALERLAAARATGRPCPPVRTLLPPGDIGAAYAVQAAWVASQVAAGDRVAGRKIGLTNPAVQAQLGVDQPDFGTLLSTMDCPPGEPIDTGRLLQPKIEAEVAFVLARDLDAPDIGPDDVLAATASVVAALEIVDSRIADWDISIVDTVADNASSGLFTLGPERRPPDGLDLAACPMRLWRDGEEVSTGSGAAASAIRPSRSPGSPPPPGRTASRSAPARSCCLARSGPWSPVRAGDRFTAEIGGLGQVTAVFAGDPR